MEKPIVLILAGGEGKNFKPLATNKTLVPFLGKPIIQHNLEMLQRTGYKRVFVVTNKHNQAWFDRHQFDIEITTKLQDKPLGMADAVLAFKKEIGQTPIIIMNAVDIVDDTLLPSILNESEDANVVVTAIEKDEYFPGGYLQVDDGRVTSIIEKPAPGTQPSNLVNLVFDYFGQPHKLIEELEAIHSDTDDIYELALQSIMKKEIVKYVSYKGYWKKLKYSHHVLDMTQLFLQEFVKAYQHPSAYVSSHAHIYGHVYIDAGAKIHENAVIKGPAYIGKNVIVGQHTLIRESLVEEGSVVGFGTEIARSYVGPNCDLHHNFIGDSILEGSINPSYGTCTGNWRLFDDSEVAIKHPDEKIQTTNKKFGAIIAKGVKFGVGCYLMPGVTIGANAKIYPGSLVHSAIPANATLKTYQKQEIVENKE